MFYKSGNSISVFAAISISLFASTNSVEGQSNFDVEPPIQADLNSHQVIMSPDPDALPTFQFAVAEVNDNGKIIIATAAAKQTLLATGSPVDPRMEMYVENVIQNYTVMVPYQEKTEDGKIVTKTRAEVRTRTVPTQRVRAKKLTQEQLDEISAQEKKDKEEGKLTDIVKMETVSRPYMVNRPVVETVGGKKLTKLKQVTVMQTVQVQRGTSKTERIDAKESYPVSEIKAFTVDGKPIESDDLKKRLADRTPVIIIRSEKAISAYFQALLKPNVIFLVCPK